MKVASTCPKCKESIAVEDINIAEGIALCRGCWSLNRLSEVLDGGSIAAATIATPPAGCWARDHGSHQVVGATTRSWLKAAFLLVFCSGWISIVSVFVGIAISESAKAIGVQLPGRFPALPNARGFLGAWVLFLWLFLLPFILVGVNVVRMALLALAGRVEITVRGGEGAVFTGIGPLGIRKRFFAGAVTSVTVERARWPQNGPHPFQIVLQADRELRFGAMLSDARMKWLTKVLNETLVRR